MEDEERQKKLEAGKAKLAEYRQRKAHADSQKKQKKKKKKKADEDSGGDSQGRVEDELERSVEGQEVPGGGEPTTEFSFTKTLRSGETVRHDHTYKIEPESEVSTTAEDYSSEEEVEYLQQLTEGQALVNMEDAARTQAEAEPTPELDGLKAAFGAEGVQQLQDFEAALKQRDGIITQLTSNLQQAREEKDEIMREFLALTDESRKLHLQFQQLQAGETLRNSSHSSTAADLFQARQQLLQNQQQLEERALEVRKHQDRSREQLELISQLEHQLSQAEMTGRRAEESFLQKMEEKELLIAEQEKVLLSQKQWMEELRAEKESFAQTLSEKSRLILEQSAIIAEHERSLALLREEMSHSGRSADHDAALLSEGKELRIADLQRVVAERDHLVTQLQEELQTSGKRQFDLQERMAAKESELKRCLQELEDTTSKLMACQSDVESCKLQLEKGQMELQSCRSELAASKEKERKSSGEIMQLMGTVEDLQKRCHQGGVSDSHSIQKVQEEKVRSLELLRAELDEQYGQQIVQMKQEVSLQHAARVQQMVEDHQAEIELLKAQQLSSRSTDIHAEVETLNAQIKELKETLEQSQTMHSQTALELSQVLQERLKLQAQVQELLRDRDAAEAKVEQVSHQIASQERKQLLQLQETIRSLRSELSAAQEATQEAEAKHESEITNYKIKLEMLEREKDAVLDRMAESQEAELERLRTQLLFSHEEELTILREGLQRENFLNTENLLNEAAVKHQAALEELGRTHAEDVLLLQQEKERFAVERDELLRQILALKEDLRLALHGSKADALVQQLQELQRELEELRKGAQERAQLQQEVQTLLTKMETLENQTKDREDFWKNNLHVLESEKETLIEDLQVKQRRVEALTAENAQMQQRAAELREEVEKQKTTFSFAEKNFEVNYQELKEEYTCLLQTKTLLEERTRRETLEFEARIALLQSQVQELQRSSRDGLEEAQTEKESSELMEKLHVTLNEKRSLEERLWEASEQLMSAQRTVQQLQEELKDAREENVKVSKQNESLQEEQAKRQEMRRKQLRGKEEEQSAERQAAEDLHRHVQPLQEEIESLQERERLQQAPELHRLSQTPSPAPLPSEEGPVEGRPPPHKPPGGGSNRRKRRQRSKQERRAAPPQREEENTMEEDGAAGRAGEEDLTDGYQGDGDGVSAAVSSHVGDGERPSLQSDRTQMERETLPHGECRLQMEAQRLSLSQIHAAQLELLQEETGPLVGGRGDLEEPKVCRYQNLIQAVTDESNQIFQSFQRVFGEDLLERVDAESRTLSLEERPETKESASIVLEARELCRTLVQVKQNIEVELRRLSRLQAWMKAEENQITADDDLKTSSEKEIPELCRRVVTSSLSAGTDLEEPTASSSSSSSSLSVELQRLKAEAQEKQLQLEEHHRLDVERLRSHYQQQAAETEERYATELFMLQRRLQEVTAADAYAGASESSLKNENMEVLKDLCGEELSEAELPGLRGSPGLTGQLQTLRRALYNKYVQEVAALKEQHSSELRRLREEQRSKRRDLNGVVASSGGSESLAVVNHLPEEEEELHQHRLEEEVAKAIVQMSVEFAQKAELTRIKKQVDRTNSSMQTQPNDEDQEVEEEQTPRASPSAPDWLEEAERERLEQELKEKKAEIQRLKAELQNAGRGAKQPLMKREDDEGQAEEEVDGTTPAAGAEGESSDGGADRYLLRLNQKLSQELLDVLKTTAAAEETIRLHVQSLSAVPGEPLTPFSSVQRGTWNRASSDPTERGTAESPRGSEGGAEDVWSGAPEDKGLEGSPQVTDSLVFAAAPQNQEGLMGTSSRLQAALEKMLVVITDTTNQLEHARMTQTELMRESFRHNQEIGELLEKQEELQERLSEEARAREQLAVELQRAEGLIDGYSDERASLEEQLRQKEELQRSLEEELQLTSSQLQELERDRLQLQGERELLSRQQDAMREEAGPREMCLVEAAMVAAPEEDLLEETEKLMKEKVEVQRQAEKENTDLLKQVKLLEAELEEQVNRALELERAQTEESSDLRQQIQALEKQLEKTRKFLDEQAVDREHERDVFQQEIQKLEQQLRSPQKLQTGSEQRNREVEQLTSQLKEKADWCSELLLSGEQLRRELGERDEEVDKLESRIRQLEQALLASAETLQQVEHKKHHDPPSQTRPPPLEAQLQTEREAVERKEKEICNLEEQLEQFKEELENKSEEVQQLHMQLEIQRKEMSSQQQHQETRERMLQVMEQKDRQIELLNDQISKLQHTGSSWENQEVDERDELLKELESQVEYLRSEQERLKRSNEEELEQLNEVIEKLQQELANIEPKTAAEEDEELKKEPGGDVWAPSEEEYDEMKQRKDHATKELEALRAQHGKLLETYLRLKDGAEALAETEDLANAEDELQDALREKTAGLLVLQAQVQALEQSAASRVEELEDLLQRRNSELEALQLVVEQTQSWAQDLQQKVCDLEDRLREKVAEALVSQATLEAFQQQQQQEETPAEELQRSSHLLAHQLPSLPPLGFSGPHQAPQMPTGKLARLTQKLRDLEAGLGAMQKDQELQKELLSSSEEEVDQYERRLGELMDLLSQMTRRRTSAETPSDEQPPPSDLLQELEEVRSEASAATDELEKCTEVCRRLEQDLREKSSTIQTLQVQIQQSGSKSAEPGVCEQKLLEAEAEAAAAKEELSSSRERLEKLQELLQEREMTIAHLKGELLQVKASEDAADTAKLFQELQEVKTQAASTKEELSFYRTHSEKLQEDLRATEASAAGLGEELQELRRNVNATKEELNGCRLRNQTLLEDLHSREMAISSLKEQLQEAQTALMKTTESDSPSLSPSPQPSSSSSSQPKRKGGKQLAGKVSSTKEKLSASRKNSAASSTPSAKSPSPLPGTCSEEQPSTAVTSFTQTEALPAPELRATATEEVEEVIGQFQEKIDQMHELHAAEILDMEARHIAESENLRRDLQALEDECKALKAVIDELRSAEAPASRQDRPASLFKDGYTSDSSSDYSQRTGFGLLQQELRTTPEGAGREAEDPLPDRIKSLIREVHQEGMQVLSLSELPLSEGQAARHVGVPGWQKERDAVLATLESVTAVVAQAQTAGAADWRADLLDAVGQVFERERSVLKSAWFSQLGLLDTSDAVVHLNQLELRLEEQDARHRDAMASLLTADRTSLLSEIQQLQSRLQQEEGGAGGGAGGGGRPRPEELQAELCQTRLELEAELKVQQKHLKELEGLRAEVSQRAAEVEELNEQLMDERKRSRDLQWAVEKEKCRTKRSEEHKREEVEDLQLSLEDLRSRVLQLTGSLEEQQQTSSALQQQAEQEHLRLRRRLQELQVQLDTERAKAEELTSALGRERELRITTSDPNVEEAQERLQRELDEKHEQVVNLLTQVEVQRLEVVQKEEELTLANQRSQQSQEAQREARVQLERLEAELCEVQEQLRTQQDSRRTLEVQKEALEERLSIFEQRPGGGDSADRTQDWVIHQRSENAPPGTTPSPRAEVPVVDCTGGAGHMSGPHHGPWRTVDKMVGKLHLVSSKIRNLARRDTGGLSAEVDADELSWIQSNVDEVVALLQRTPGLPSFSENPSLLAGGTSSSSNSLTERLLRQNAELTGFVSRLTEEKNDLRNRTLRLEEELRRYRQAGFGPGFSSSRRAVPSGSVLSQQQEVWTQEKIRLEKALLLAQAQVSRLREEIRSNAVQEITGPEADNAALKRMYGRYLRAESFRKALVYQKKYLLLLLGGFQECEEATLFLLTRMGGRPALEPLSQRRRGLTRFRSAARVAIALSRMRFLVKRWHRAAGMNSAPSTKNGAGVEVRESSLLHPAAADLHRERGGGEGVSGGRGRSGSPRSGPSSSHHRLHAASDPAALTCSHLQGYDPDRALTDYISRLEALQRRLGSVASGSSSYAQTHCGLRR